jgi:hypothetical protein
VIHKVYIVHMYRHMQNHTDILKNSVFPPEVIVYALGEDKFSNSCSVINY